MEDGKESHVTDCTGMLESPTTLWKVNSVPPPHRPLLQTITSMPISEEILLKAMMIHSLYSHSNRGK